MRKRKAGTLGEVVASIACMTASAAWALPIVEIADWTTIKGANGSNTHFAAVVDGTTSYHQLSGSNSPAITKVDNLGGTLTSTTLVNKTQWAAVGGGTGLTTFYGFSAYGSYLQFGDTSTDCIWRVDKNSGAITKYVDRATIAAVAGSTGSGNVLGSADTAPDGEFVFREQDTKNILKTTGVNSAIKLVTAAELSALQGNADVNGGLTFDAAGTMYWGNNTNGGLYYQTSAGVLGTLVSGLGTMFNDIFYAPDGWIYFHDNLSKDIKRLNPVNPAGTFGTYISAAELVAGAGSSSVSQFTWYNDTLAWNLMSTKGLYIPEPASLSLLACGTLGLLRRRNRV